VNIAQSHQFDGLLPSGVRLEPAGKADVGHRWLCDCGDKSMFVSVSVEFLMADYSRHLNTKHRRR
jgi:hypothetical protein